MNRILTTTPLIFTFLFCSIFYSDEQDEKACRLITGGVDKALYFMMQTSETDYEREKWIQSNWPIYDIKGKTNVYVAMGKHIHSYNVNGELLKEFSFEKATK